MAPIHYLLYGCLFILQAEYVLSAYKKQSAAGPPGAGTASVVDVTLGTDGTVNVENLSVENVNVEGENEETVQVEYVNVDYSEAGNATNKPKARRRASYGADESQINLPGTFSLRAEYHEGKEIKYVNYYQNSEERTSRIEMLDKDNKPLKAYLTVNNQVVMLTPGRCTVIENVDVNNLHNYDFPNFMAGDEVLLDVRGMKIVTTLYSQPENAKKRETFNIAIDKDGNQVPVRGCLDHVGCMDIQKFCRNIPNSKFFEVDICTYLQL